MTQPGYVRYDARAALLEYSGLSRGAELAARRLRDWTWAFGRPPAAAPANLATIARVTRAAWPAVEQELLEHGWRKKDSLFAHPPTLRLLREACAARRNFLRWGKEGARLRWHRSSAIPDDQSSMSNPQLPQAGAPTCSRLGMRVGPEGIRGPSVAQSRLQVGAPAAVSRCATPEPLAPLSPPHSPPMACPMPVKGEGKGTVPESTLTRSTAERSAASARKSGAGGGAGPGKAARKAEADFLAEVGQLCEAVRKGSGRAELANWGGWWRSRFRENPDKCRTILADVRSMHREGRLTGPPGPACFDLWNRLP